MKEQDMLEKYWILTPLLLTVSYYCHYRISMSAYKDISQLYI